MDLPLLGSLLEQHPGRNQRPGRPAIIAPDGGKENRWHETATNLVATPWAGRPGRAGNTI
jgi:hypothetical protein